jgi:peptide-methionine (S)-S-oxide reductase
MTLKSKRPTGTLKSVAAATVVLAAGLVWSCARASNSAPPLPLPSPSMDVPRATRPGTGDTGHAESVRITFDPSQITFGQLLKVFFSVAHDPTELNRQGPDEGTQYRSVVFFTSAEQKRVADGYIAELDRAKLFHDRIVTQVVPLKAFYAAEAYHQNYARLHPNDPYIVFNDAPKVAHLRQLFPGLYRGT